MASGSEEDEVGDLRADEYYRTVPDDISKEWPKFIHRNESEREKEDEDLRAYERKLYKRLAEEEMHQERSPFRCHNYRMPKTTYGAHSFWMDVTMQGLYQNPPVDSTSDGAGIWPVQVGSSGALPQPQYLHNITTARRWFDSSEEHRLDLTCENDFKMNASECFRWLHVQRSSLDLDEFETIALNTPGLSDNWRLLTRGLFKRIRTLAQTHDRNSWKPWLVRADACSVDPLGEKSPDLSAYSVSFPYFATAEKNHDGTSNAHLFTGQGLFEDTGTGHRNLNQLFPKMVDDKSKNEHFIFVAHVWTLILDKNLITYGPVSIDELCGNSIKLLTVETADSGAPTKVHVTDMFDYTYVLELRECQTFFELERLIQERCLNRTGASRREVEVRSKNGTILTGNDWLTAIVSEQSNMIPLVLCWKPRTVEQPPSKASISKPLRLLAPPAQSRGSSPERPYELKSEKDLVNKRHAIEYEAEQLSEYTSSSISSESEESSSVSWDYIDEVRPPIRRLEENQISQRREVSSSSWKFTSERRRRRRASIERLLGATMKLEKDRKNGLVVFDSKSLVSPTIYKAAAPEQRLYSVATRDENPGTASYSHKPKTNGERTATDTSTRYTEVTNDEFHGMNPKATPAKETSTKIIMSVPKFLEWAVVNEIGTRKSARSTDILNRILEASHDRLLNKGLPKHNRIYSQIAGLDGESIKKRLPYAIGIRRSPSHVDTDAYNQDSTHSQSKKTSDTAKTNMLYTSIWISADPFHEKLIQRCSVETLSLYELTLRLVDLYLPPSSDHIMIRKCWGVFASIILDLDSLLENKHHARIDKKVKYWIVRNALSDEGHSGIVQPSIPWDQCQTCETKTEYHSYDEGVQHLQTAHFLDSEKLDHETIAWWLRDNFQYRIDICLDRCLQYLQRSLTGLQGIYDEAELIREGVASASGSKPRKYQLPASLVNAFEGTVLFLVLTARSIKLVSRYIRRPQNYASSRSGRFLGRQKESLKFPQKIDDSYEECLAIAEKARRLTFRAADELLLMAHTNVEIGVINYDAVGPEYLLVTVLANLTDRPVHGKERIEQLYKSYYEKLYLDVLKHPRARIVRDIFSMRGEISAILRHIDTQGNMLANLGKLLEPCSFRVTTALRCVRFRAENNFGHRIGDHRSDVWRDLRDTDDELMKLNTDALQMLQVSDENSRNAIMVFTVVATVFLPLSWATSYLGMNTSDVRTLAQGQWLFWSVAVPIVAVVIGSAVLLVKKGEDINEFILRQRRELSTKRKTRREHQKTQLLRRTTTMITMPQDKRSCSKPWAQLRKKQGRSNVAVEV